MNKVMYSMWRLSLAAALILTAFTLHAESNTAEVDYLIDFVARSGCSFTRNGNRHDATEAAEHMQKKYRYFSASSVTAEQFIEMAASRSSLTGKPYSVHCEGKPEQPTQAWLLAELERYRTIKSVK